MNTEIKIRERPTCGKCQKVMTPENSTVSPELFLCDTCADPQKRIEALEQELRYISENLCGVKIEGEVTFDMVYHFVEAQIEKQSDRADKAQHSESELRKALEESLKLQSHYAKLLNIHDGGERRGFNSVEEWVKRLAECEK